MDVTKKMSVKIRKQEQADYKIVQNITREAFWNQYIPGTNRHYVVHTFRKSPVFIPQLSLVAVSHETSQIVGHIIYTHSHIQYPNNIKLATITFGPISVSPIHQFQGFGTLLIQQSLKKAKQMGFKAVLMQGRYDYYKRFGFKFSRMFNIKDDDGKYHWATMALQLEEGYLSKLQKYGLDLNTQGIFKKSELFNPKLQDVDQFEKQFPPKEKHKTKSQQIFKRLNNRIWDQEYEYTLSDFLNKSKI